MPEPKGIPPEVGMEVAHAVHAMAWQVIPLLCRAGADVQASRFLVELGDLVHTYAAELRVAKLAAPMLRSAAHELRRCRDAYAGDVTAEGALPFDHAVLALEVVV